MAWALHAVNGPAAVSPSTSNPARKQLMAAKKERDQASVEGCIEANRRVKVTQLKYDEVHAKREEIKAALKAKGLYPEFRVVSWEEYEAARARHSSDYFVQG